MISPVVKVVMLVVCIAANHIATTPPNSPASKKERVKDISMAAIIENNMRRIVFSLQLLNEATFVIEIYTTLAISFGWSIQSFLFKAICPLGLRNPSELLSLSPRFVIGHILVILGGLIRLWCYTALGDLFTFEIAVRDKHRLVTTGPYAYARHPSYTGGMIILAGIALAQSARGSWITEGNIMESYFVYSIYYWYLVAITLFIIGIRRTGVEDRKLKQIFGKDWEAYRTAVPYAWIPGVY